MGIGDTLQLDSRSWNRSVLNAYWLIFLLIVCSEIWGYFYALSGTPQLLGQNMKDTVILTDSFLIVMLILVEWLYRHMTRRFEYLLILVGVYIPGVLFVFNNHLVEGVQITFILPVLMSTYYFSSKRIAFAGTLTILLCLILFPLKIQESNTTLINEIISTVTMTVGTCMLALAIRTRGLELIRELQDTLKNEQNLIIQNIVMDKISKEDALTGLNNHKTFYAYIDRLIEQAEGNGLQLQLAVIDIDNFKSVNDTYGHWVGDIVLKETAHVIESLITSEDIASRYGGEEFAVIFTNKSIELSFTILDQIRDNLSQITYKQMPERRVTISAGLSEYRIREGKESFFNKSDSYLYEAKHNGKNKIVRER